MAKSFKDLVSGNSEEQKIRVDQKTTRYLSKMMSRQEMIEFVENQVKKGLSREDSIRNLAFFMDEDDPVELLFHDPEVWFQQMIAGE